MTTVSIIGGGISGSFAANLLTKNNIETILIEKNYKIGTEHSKSLNAIDNWYKTDLMRMLKVKIPAKPIYESTWHSPLGNEFNLKFRKKPLFYLVKRGDRNDSINRILLEDAKKNGCKIYKNCRKIKIKRNKNSFEVSCLNDTKKIINADIIVNASRFSERNKISKENLGIAFGGEIIFKKCIDKSKVEVFFDEKFFPGGYMYILPENENKATVGATMRPHLMKRGMLSKDYFLESLKKNKCISEKFKNSKIISTFSGVGNLSGPKEEIENKNILLIGDAANFMEPLFGFGVRNALLSAKFCSDSIKKANNEIEKCGKLYKGICKKELFPILKKQKFLRDIYDKLNNDDIEFLFSLFESFSKKTEVETFIENPSFNFSLLSLLILKLPKLISLTIK
jgi:flavin-dependent dehydrogenase